MDVMLEWKMKIDRGIGVIQSFVYNTIKTIRQSSASSTLSSFTLLTRLKIRLNLLTFYKLIYVSHLICSLILLFPQVSFTSNSIKQLRY